VGISLIDASGLSAQLMVQSADLATMDDLLRVHERNYLKKLSGISATDSEILSVQ